MSKDITPDIKAIMPDIRNILFTSSFQSTSKSAKPSVSTLSKEKILALLDKAAKNQTLPECFDNIQKAIEYVLESDLYALNYNVKTIDKKVARVAKHLYDFVNSSEFQKFKITAEQNYNEQQILNIKDFYTACEVLKFVQDDLYFGVLSENLLNDEFNHKSITSDKKQYLVKVIKDIDISILQYLDIDTKVLMIQRACLLTQDNYKQKAIISCYYDNYYYKDNDNDDDSAKPSIIKKLYENFKSDPTLSKDIPIEVLIDKDSSLIIKSPVVKDLLLYIRKDVPLKYENMPFISKHSVKVVIDN